MPRLALGMIGLREPLHDTFETRCLFVLQQSSVPAAKRQVVSAGTPEITMANPDDCRFGWRRPVPAQLSRVRAQSDLPAPQFQEMCAQFSAARQEWRRVGDSFRASLPTPADAGPPTAVL